MERRLLGTAIRFCPYHLLAAFELVHRLRVVPAVALAAGPVRAAEPFYWDRYHARQDACREADRIAADCARGLAYCDELALWQTKRACSQRLARWRAAQPLRRPRQSRQGEPVSSDGETDEQDEHNQFFSARRKPARARIIL